MTMPPAGWYPDPAGSGGSRWWTGASWGDQVQPPAHAAPVTATEPWHVSQQYGAAGQQYGAAHQQYGAAGQQYGQTGQPPGGASAAGQPWGDRPAPTGFARQNRFGLIAVGISLLLVVLAAAAHVVVLAVLPVIFAVRAVQAKEPLAWPAAGVTAAVLLFAAINFF